MIENRVKILVLLFSILFSSSSCNKLELIEEGFGEINLVIDSDKEIIIETKSSETEDELNSYLLSITKGEEIIMNNKLYSSVVVNGKIGMKNGEGYILTAQNCTESEALEYSNNWGRARFSGTSDQFDIVSDKSTNVSVKCTMQNAKVCVAYDASFVYTFTDYEVCMYEDSNPQRKLIFDKNASLISPFGYFNIDDSPNLKYEIRGRVNGGNIKVLYEGSVELSASKCIKLICRSTPNGKVETGITVDNSVTDKSEDIDINPYL